MTLFRSLFHSPWAKRLLYLIASLGVVCLINISIDSSISLGDLESRSYSSFHCDLDKRTIFTADSNGVTRPGNTFRILELVYWSKKLALALCESPALDHIYAGVEVDWKKARWFDVGDIFNQKYDLILAQEERIQQSNLGTKVGYTPIAQLPTYASYLIAIDSTPELSNEYFRGKKLGLVDDPFSVSGYQIPRKALKTHQVDESLFEIVLYQSHKNLYQALVSGEVDIIGSYIPIPKAPGSLVNPNLMLEDNLPRKNWYLRQSLLDTDIHCEIIKQLLRHANKSDSMYRRSPPISITRACAL